MNYKMSKLVFPLVGHIIVKWLFDVSTNSKGLFCDPIFPRLSCFLCSCLTRKLQIGLLNAHNMYKRVNLSSVNCKGKVIEHFGGLSLGTKYGKPIILNGYVKLKCENVVMH